MLCTTCATTSPRPARPPRPAAAAHYTHVLECGGCTCTLTRKARRCSIVKIKSRKERWPALPNRAPTANMFSSAFTQHSTTHTHAWSLYEFSDGFPNPLLDVLGCVPPAAACTLPLLSVGVPLRNPHAPGASTCTCTPQSSKHVCMPPAR